MPLFFHWLVAKIKKEHYRCQSIDEYVHLFTPLYPKEPCSSTVTVYRYIDGRLLPTNDIDLPQKLRSPQACCGPSPDRKNKRLAGNSVEERPTEGVEYREFGNWGGDLVKGKRPGNEPALLASKERKSRFELIHKIPDYLTPRPATDPSKCRVR